MASTSICATGMRICSASASDTVDEDTIARCCCSWRTRLLLLLLLLVLLGKASSFLHKAKEIAHSSPTCVEVYSRLGSVNDSTCANVNPTAASLPPTALLLDDDDDDDDDDEDEVDDDDEEEVVVAVEVVFIADLEGLGMSPARLALQISISSSWCLEYASKESIVAGRGLRENFRTVASTLMPGLQSCGGSGRSVCMYVCVCVYVCKFVCVN